MASAAVLQGRVEKLAAIPQQDKDARLEWTKQMRLKYSPKGSCNSDGTINQEYFKPKQVVTVDDKKWGEAEREALYKGLELFGVGKWREISEEYLNRWDDQNIRVKAAKLLGSQSLARYVGWQGDRAAVDAERELNRKIGAETGCWKGGMLVEDDAGTVKKALERLAAAKQ